MIAGTGSSTPEKVLSNTELESIVDTTDEWITKRTGIKERRISMNGGTESVTGMATQASVKALQMAGIKAEELDLIVVGTVTSDRPFPSVACMVQDALHATNAAAFDISAGCSGFIYALEVANNAIRSGGCRSALVIGTERLSSVLNWQDRSTCVLLGDGAGAVVLTATSEEEGILSTHLKSDGTLWDLLYSSHGSSPVPELLKGIHSSPFYLKMDGHRLFKKAVECLSSIAREALDHNALRTEDLAMVIPHQANLRILQALAKSINISMDRVYTNLQTYGNTSSASIPIALDEANRKGVLEQATHVLLLSFGAGLTWGASMVKWFA
jgi:3-oxoacyl-[acyl-carrier-protein] synthase-3